MRAIILVGGKGTRLRPLTVHQPKPLLPILNKPFIRYQLDLLKQGGVTQVALAVGQHAKQWAHSVQKISPKGLKIRLSVESKPMGTGGAIRLAYDNMKWNKSADASPIIAMNGDVFIQLDVKGILRQFKRESADGCIALTRVEDISQFGLVKTTKAGRILAFLEKLPVHRPGWINGGAYALSPKVISSIPKNPCSIERDIFPALLKTGHTLFGYQINGYWNDIGRPETYLKAHLDLLQKNNRWTEHKFLRKRGLHSDSSVRRGRKISIRGRGIVGTKSKIGDETAFHGAVCVGKNVRIGKGCVIKDSVLLDDCRLGEFVHLDGVIVGRRSRIGDHAHIGAGTVLGDASNVTSYTKG